MLMAQIMGSYKVGSSLMPGKISGNRITNNIVNKDTGIFGFYAACDEVAVEHCLGELMLGMNMLSFSVTDEEVERAKRELKTKIFSGLDSSLQSCTDIGLQTLNYGRVMPPAELIARLDQIDARKSRGLRLLVSTTVKSP